MTEEEVAPAEVAAPEQQGPPDPPRKRLWQNLNAKVKDFAVPYEQFEQDMNDPEARARLHTNLSPGGKLHKVFQGFAVPREQFDADMGAADEPITSPPPQEEEASATVVAKKKDEAAGPPAGAGSQEFVSASPAGPDWDYLNKLPAGPAAELYTVNGSAPRRVGSKGRVEEVINLPKAEKGTERVRLPDDLPAEAVPPGTYQLKASTEPNARYFDRPLSKIAEGETEEQDKWTAASRTFVNSLKEMGQGIPEYLGAAARRVNDLTGGSPAAGLYAGAGLDHYAEAIEQSKEKVAPYHAQAELELGSPATWPVPAARTAALAVPLVLSAAFPESKIAGVLQTIGAAGFDSQIVHGSFERAKAAGLTPGSKEYDAYALADATATLVVFKGLGHVLEAPAQTLLRKALVNETLERVAGGETFDAAFAAASKSAAQLVRATGAGAATMATVGAANAVKTKLGERAFNAATDTKTFAEKSLGEDAADVLGEAGQMALIGAAAGAAGAAGQRRVEAPTFDVVRPTGQKEFENVRVLGQPDAQGEVEILAQDERGQPVQTKVKAAYLKARDNANLNPAGEQAGDDTGETGHPEGPRPAQAQGGSEAAEALAPEARGRDSESNEPGAEPRGGAEPTGGVQPVAHEEVKHLLPDLPAEAEVLSSDDKQVAAAILPTGEVRLRASEDALPGAGAQVLDAALERGVQSLSVDSPALASYLEEAGWTVAERTEQGIRLMAPVEAEEGVPELTDTNAGQSAPEANATQAATVQHAPRSADLTPADVEPHIGPLKPVREVLGDLRKALGGAIKFGRGTGAAAYDPNSRVTSFKPNDLKDASHEIGHALDDRYGVVPAVGGAAYAELSSLIPTGQAAPAGHPNATAYHEAEGLAELVRQLVTNPQYTRATYPELTALYEQKVPADVRAGIEEFSRQARGHLGEYRPGATNVEYGKEQPGRAERFKQWLKGPDSAGRPAWFNRWDRFLGDWVDPLRPFQKAEDYFRRVLDKPLDPQHPRSVVNQMVRLYDLMGKIADISERGMRAFSPRVVEDVNGVPSTERIIDGVTGEAKTDDWLFQPFAAGGDHQAAKAKREYAGEVGVAQRTVSLSRDILAGRVEDALDSGGVVDPAFFAAHPDIAQRKIEVTDPATYSVKTKGGQVVSRVKKTPATKRVITYEEASRENATRSQAREQRLVDARQRLIDQAKQGRASLRDRRLAVAAERYDARIDKARSRPATVAIDEKLADAITGLGKQGSGDADVAKAQEILAYHERLRQSDKQYADDVDEGLRRYRSMAQDVIAYLRDAGRLSTEQYEAITGSGADYIALQRVMEANPGEDVSNTFKATPRRGIGGGQKVVYRQVGSGRSIKDPWVSMLAARTRSIDAADRNAVLRSWRDLAVDTRQMNDPTATADAADGAGNLMRQVPEAKDGNLTIYVDGKAEYWQLDPDFAQFISEFGEVLPGNFITKGMNVFKALLTKTPKFVVRNLPRDLLDQLINSRSGQVKGIVENLGPNGRARRAAADELLEAHGGSQGGDYPRTEAEFDTYINRTIAKVNGSKKSFATRTADVGRKYLELVESSERLGRRREATAAYREYKDAGFSNEDAALGAALRARGLMDFARAGRVARKFNQYFPFLTARIAGLRTMFTSAGQSPGKWALRYFRYAVVPVLMEQALIGLMGRDDEYEQKSVAEKQGFFNIPLPDGGWLMVAKPFEIGASATYLVAAAKEYGGGVENAAEGQFSHLAKSFLPAEDFVPTGPLGAAVDASRNRDDWRDQAIVPEREKSLRLDDPNRHQERASRLAQGLGYATRIDARKVDYFIRSTTGMVGQLAQSASDIGRDDKQGNWSAASGLYRTDPVAHARDVEWLNQKFAEWGVTNNADMKQLKAKVDAWYDASEEDKPELGEQVRELARELRRQYPEERIRELRAAKDGYGEEED